MTHINTEELSARLREKAINLRDKKILITNYNGSEQQKDLTEPANCQGFGRIRHFKLGSGEKWPVNPLPIIPAAKALGVANGKEIRAQVFQNSICNWRCWYCFVDFSLLKGDINHASFLSCDEMLDLFLAENNPPTMIDLSGGQPDLTPEWVPWMMEALIKRGLDKKIYLWSDDNLSNDYLWRFLSKEQINLMSSYKMYSRVCCFKGIDEESFSINTNADPKLFLNQFELCKRLIDIGLDLYCYITLTAPTKCDFDSVIPKFMDKAQKIHKMLPLRIIPLQISEFTPMKARMNEVLRDAMEGQYSAINIWNQELKKRYTSTQLNTPITDISIR